MKRRSPLGLKSGILVASLVFCCCYAVHQQSARPATRIVWKEPVVSNGTDVAALRWLNEKLPVHLEELEVSTGLTLEGCGLMIQFRDPPIGFVSKEAAVMTAWEGEVPQHHLLLFPSALDPHQA